jgi:hypothetical protein
MVDFEGGVRIHDKSCLAYKCSVTLGISKDVRKIQRLVSLNPGVDEAQVYLLGGQPWESVST